LVYAKRQVRAASFGQALLPTAKKTQCSATPKRYCAAIQCKYARARLSERVCVCKFQCWYTQQSKKTLHAAHSHTGRKESVECNLLIARRRGAQGELRRVISIPLEPKLDVEKKYAREQSRKLQTHLTEI